MSQFPTSWGGLAGLQRLRQRLRRRRRAAASCRAVSRLASLFLDSPLDGKLQLRDGLQLHHAQLLEAESVPQLVRGQVLADLG